MIIVLLERMDCTESSNRGTQRVDEYVRLPGNGDHKVDVKHFPWNCGYQLLMIEKDDVTKNGRHSNSR